MSYLDCQMLESSMCFTCKLSYRTPLSGVFVSYNLQNFLHAFPFVHMKSSITVSRTSQVQLISSRSKVLFIHSRPSIASSTFAEARSFAIVRILQYHLSAISHLVHVYPATHQESFVHFRPNLHSHTSSPPSNTSYTTSYPRCPPT